MSQLNIDCEGPITQNDNAFELCEALIPGGGDFFARVSRYDDYLADVERRPGYKAGDTLKLVLPFLAAFGATRAAMEDFSRRTLALLPGAREMLARLAAELPTFIVSTSYRPYLDALCAATGFPPENVYCTEVDPDACPVPPAEKGRLSALAAEIAAMPLLSWPDGAARPEDLPPGMGAVVRRLDEIFWEEIPAMAAGRILEGVNPVGGPEKARAVADSLRRTGNPVSGVTYVGDSITDVEALRLVEEGGGAGISFNGNAYAVRAAGWACTSGHAGIVAALVRLSAAAGREALEALPWPEGGAPLEGAALLGALEAAGVPADLLAPLRDPPGGLPPRLWRLDDGIRPRVIPESERVRRAVRGLAVGALG
ncbi:hypothetical protein G3N55_03095 [Dissulfurirhabdus thermomarina]|uniref:HAD hydrolase family protein n=1 Tax=Dissulfurirhabdus thermomarina TaxID=1765737 RepID=A0A6N9TKP0_DISTH|nr:haloacid dehalogenase-like hydrolase [Dissulfurirhabdus thermomarina]NDY41841.1 hypothetical protein [Dissulfurirhabdus thermomarina]NMX23839.1 hypothetical protein [Dissulfurirhabdus thermomarina]